MEEKDIQKETLKPITKVNSKLDKELQEWQVQSTAAVWDFNQSSGLFFKREHCGDGQ